MPKYEVVFRMEITASNPIRAARSARDAMLDPNAELHADIHELEYVKEADDWFPDYDRGWSMRFGGPVRQLNFKWSGNPVDPSECVEWVMSNAHPKR